MKKLKVFVFLLIVLLITGLTGNALANKEASHEPSKTVDLHVNNLFQGMKGTTLIKNLKTGKTYVYNSKRSQIRFTPESTFKIPNALIGLQTKAVNDEYEVKRWDGIVREFDEWNTDHTLASGMRHSVIWFYQAMARDIGAHQMQKYVNKVNYGNRNTSGGIDHFWLDSSLKISAQEQLHFIENLVKEKLPFNKQVMRTVKRIMINEEADSYVLHEKTGTRLADMGLGWYVGYVETKSGDWVFTTNVDGSGTNARNITLDVLKKLNIISNKQK